MIDAILWDLDGTLVDSEPCHGQAFVGALKELGLTSPENAHEALLGTSEADVHQYVGWLGADVTLAEWADLKWKHYQAAAPAIKLRQDVYRTVCAFGHLPMAVVSNSSRRIVELNLAACDLNHRISITISRDDVVCGKPSPEGYLLAASRLGKNPTSCVVVEDSPVGVLAGINAGCRTIFAPQSASDLAMYSENAIIVRSGTELSRIMTELISGSCPSGGNAGPINPGS